MTEQAERLTSIARGWDEAADGYEAYYVPRFAPWVEVAVRAIAGALPDGPVLVPCCGTFPELDVLVEYAGDREIVGIDLSSGMVRLAGQRAARHPRVNVIQGDASTLDPAWTGRCAAVVSVFGLQQLPEPEHAIASWAAALRPGGRLSVVYWPGTTEHDGPFARLAALLDPHDDSWESRLIPALTAQGALLDRDDHPSFPMTHPDAATFFDAHTRSGPLRPFATSRGEDFITHLRTTFLHHSPTGAWHHHPRARHLLAHKP
ncbi:class I SAM-dependent methyltransferase [Nonomuraea sp. NPDC050536]|uniref:class I SAM-dependent methyltransferase n=1 Tax=Nonomuraea sp. NPDC050536 TaxID=3364366 RepID=UPI0037CA814F